MSVPARPPTPLPPPLRASLIHAIDWRTVAAIGLPLWAFILGAILVRVRETPAPALALLAPPPAPTASAPEPPLPEPTPVAPRPREIVVRTQFTAVPVLVPVAVPAEPAVANAPAPAEFRLPASEFLPAERCQTFNTKVKFHPGMTEAAEEARNSKKMLLVLHISGHFDDPGFT
ncbi:hypothetical protein GobsT_27970 [Gemmata obscuriglobus]|uniref:hypothetical protein n=1 Tax=Gemmata obscuriglobus TaxID=114 RepID=UPI0011CCFE66|nr:hypothetical protein [Gemmata obscuriglobus]QEG28028.1 hypothetical protein GobsT_27970 [Gemmata obscuriglobus]VTS05582.1 unnamed protein product [Gemmata obscuriglobus UQM 2246]